MDKNGEENWKKEIDEEISLLVERKGEIEGKGIK